MCGYTLLEGGLPYVGYNFVLSSLSDSARRRISLAIHLASSLHFHSPSFILPSSPPRIAANEFVDGLIFTVGCVCV